MPGLNNKQNLKQQKTFYEKDTFTLTTGEVLALLFIFGTTVVSLIYSIPVFNW